MPDSDLCEIPDIHRRKSHRLAGDVGRLPETSGARATNDRLCRLGELAGRAGRSVGAPIL
ncbi:hypothetical protein MICRO116_710005 [Micrococcus sp. 116]|nr:hypothetical protein MICRO116_710005 [Micrococcus sp. 116]